jgi:predicted kinase
MSLSKFFDFLTEFERSPLWHAMENTVEASMWHREANVAVHTRMVFSKFMDLILVRGYNERESLVGLLALLYHDVGKPIAELVKDKKDGSGVYRSYAGHEQSSAIAFREEYLTNPLLRELLTPFEARAVCWIIEHHLPYGIQHSDKRRALAIATRQAMEQADLRYDLFFDCLRADAAGRISDDHETKLQTVEDWIGEFKLVDSNLIVREPTRNTVYLLIGPSGSGKSTWVNNRKIEIDVVLSMDDLKRQYFIEAGGVETESVKLNYDLAWEHARVNEPEFRKFAKRHADKLFATQVVSSVTRSVFVDITNLSKKVRAPWVDQARRNGARIVGVEFWSTLETLAARQKTRGDKEVPYASLQQQSKAFSLCYAGHEVDDLFIMIDGKEHHGGTN